MEQQSKDITNVFYDNFKKTVTEMLLLELLCEGDTYIGDLQEIIKTRSNETLQIIFPYAAIYRLVDDEYIAEIKKRTAPDGRRRQYYTITESGRAYLEILRNAYTSSIQAVEDIVGAVHHEKINQTLSEEAHERASLSQKTAHDSAFVLGGIAAAVPV